MNLWIFKPIELKKRMWPENALNRPHIIRPVRTHLFRIQTKYQGYRKGLKVCPANLPERCI